MNSQTRVYVIFGQGGRWLSWGMVSLADRLRELQYDVVDSFPWYEPHKVVSNIREMQRRGPGKIALIGFSLGGNATTWIADSGVPIDLLVAYDPSEGLLWMNAAPPKPIGGNVKRALCYQQVGPEIVGRAKLTGNVTTVEVVSPHLLVQSNEELHNITLRALAQISAVKEKANV